MIRKLIKPSEPLPTGYRRTWLTDDSMYICYPLGIHWVMRTLYRWLRKSRSYNPHGLEIKQIVAYNKGFDDGLLAREDLKAKQFSNFSADVQAIYEEQKNDLH